MIFSGRYHPVGVSLKPLKAIRRRRASTKRTKHESDTNQQFCPVTPPPSPRPEDAFWDNLVHIKMIMIDQKSPDFITKYAGTHKHTRVDFNILEVLLTPETFACLRQFFSDASKHGKPSPPPLSNTYAGGDNHGLSASNLSSNLEFVEQQQRNSETIINVRALMVKLARTTGSLAEAEVNDVHCELKSRGMNYFGVDGRLGSLEVRDISAYAGLYPLKFVFQGEQALDFDYVRVGSDAKFRLKMSSIVCVHTNRFYTEFSSLWSSLFGSSSKDAETPVNDEDHGNMEMSTDSSSDSVKVILDIQAGAPVIILPYSATSEKLLIVDLGHLSVKNKFIEEASDMVLNITSIDLIEMDLYSGFLQSLDSEEETAMAEKFWKLHHGTAVVKTSGNSSFLKKKCALNLKMRRYFTGITPDSQAVTFIQGTLSTVHCTVNSDKYKLVRGLLQYNIGEPIEMEHVVAVPNRESTLRVGPTGNVIKSRLDLGIELELVNVILEVLKDEDYHLSRIDFLKSKFTFQSNSDGTKDVDLASQEILIADIRKDDVPVSMKQQDGNVKYTKNCFKNILQQSGMYVSSQPNYSAPHSSSFQPKVPLQAEIHYRQTQRGTNVTIVLNNMRLMLILDWWMEVLAFLSQKIVAPKPHPHQKGLYEKTNAAKQRNISPVLERSKEMSAPITVSAGIVTKRAPVLDIPESTFELKMNVSSCELVLVEDPAVWDSNAIILKSTAMLGYRPHLERPISCSLLECELFSCILGLESDTALSILDPTNIQIELVRQAYAESQGILDATLSMSSTAKILKLQSPNLSLRLSYYDMKMFIKFLERFSKEAKIHFQKRSKSESLDQEYSSIESHIEDTDLQVPYGFQFSVNDESLTSTQSNRDYYGSMNSDSVAPLIISDPSPSDSTNGSTICGIEVKCNFLSLCVIDDCKDADVPLLEVGVQTLELTQNCTDNCGSAECVLSGDYYNRALSGWEPFVEQWKCTISWQKNLIGKLGAYSPNSEFPSKAPELELSIHSRKTLDVNITSTLLNLYRTVSSNWTEDYQLQKSDKRRSPFVPFALRNETGSPLWFRAVLSENDVVIRERAKAPDEFSDRTGWMQVNHLAVQSFSFEGRVKLRHRNTHQLRTHQLTVRVDGWQEVTPVSVDKVGTYFRIANPVIQRRFGLYTELPPTRLVFEVSLEGSAQKLVTVRSALQVKNSLPDPVELKLENTIVYPSFERAQTGGSFVAKIDPGKVYPIPLHSVWAHMWVRPLIPDGALSSQYSYCTKALLVTNQDSQISGLRECTSVTSEEQQCYRFCVAVKRDDFPADDEQIIPQNTLPSLAQLMSTSKGANLVTLKSPLRISNSLPHELTFEIRLKGISGHIAPGKDFEMTNVDTSEQFEIIFTTETFSQTSPLTVNPSVNGVAARLKMLDAQKRIIFMTARVRRGEGGMVTIALCCPFWIINKSGLPIVCKQEGASAEAAGQFQEHEVGRMVTPLLFSFADQETSEAMSLRVGNGFHKGSKPYWCRAFLCQNGTRVRKLTVSHSNNRPESVYTVGVEVKSGSGRYRDTKLVVISPRFVVDNRSSRRVQISQRVYATSFYDAAAQATHLTLTPDCNLPFHWPRLDRDQLLCIKLVDIENGLWSGGFPIDNVDSFHVNIRDRDGNCIFLRVEIVLQGSTYFIILNDTEQLPPPFRIDNLAFVPITFHQACVGEERLKLTAKAESSLPYALDEPTQPAHITLEAPGGTSVIVNMDALGSTACITYENFFYIALTATFPPEEEGDVIVGIGMEALHLVLEVPIGTTKVTLAKKEPGKLSQLWRVNADGLIEHEGSRPLGDPKQTEPSGTRLVLDIAGSAPQPSQCVALMLRRPDKRRASTQHWEFTLDGRLKLSMYANMYVQAKDGFGLSGMSYEAESQESNGASWKLWSEVVLGPPQPVCYIRTATGIHAEQAVCRQKLRGGSGKLNLEVLTDGPTRVIRVHDEDIPPRIHLFRHTFESSNYNTTPKFRIKVDLKNGLGISVVSCNPREELVYCKLSCMMVEWTESKESQIVKAAVENLQIDNQLNESEKSAVMYVTASERFETVEDLSAYEPQPALRLGWESMKSKLNAHVFKYWELEIRPLSVVLEERLLLKFCNWLDVGQNTQSFDGLRESDFEVQKAFTNTASLTAKRFYFGMLKILLNQVRLSVLTSSKLPPDLAVVKRRLGLTLIRFEDAIVDLDAFIKFHPFETFEFLLAMVIKHYRDELMSQAAVILGSTDFLGNPLGFVNDVSVGISGLIYEGSMVSLMKNVTHGISNSAAKVTGSLGEVLGGRTILDDKHEEERRRIKEEHSGNSSEHLYAGLKGFGHGFLGGVTSIVAQSYEGLSNDGVSGLLTGIGKGIVGTVTKPAVGILDLASGAASAIRDSSQTSSRLMPPRVRPTRVVVGNGGLLPQYSEMAARGQEMLYDVNDRNYKELFIGCESLKSGPNQDLRIMISSEAITVFKPGKGYPILLKVPLSDLMECRIAELNERGYENNPYIEFVRQIRDAQAGGPCRPQVMCESESVAKRVVQQVNYAKVLYEELRHSQKENTSSNSDE
ncbi:Vacuolar protein sorting-associated protein 13D [Orchesella cincta]|uniref:Vacuolar protein sorting-associated protein 13D n=1 Tax=Orchesella cincta TaxID=48709 RepID=A0A1D2N975_ORCCI|nr:Vacuolar protein sorting-associated protein 13D [Orchesella cincta]